MSDEKIAGGFVMGDGLQQGGNDDRAQDESQQPASHWTISPDLVKGPAVYPTFSRPWRVDIPRYMTEEQARTMICEEVHRALYPEQDGIVGAHRHRRIKQIDEDGTEWRGVLYPVDVYKTDPMLQAVVPTGICWACKRPGESVAMAWYGTHLIHATEECRELAGRTPEQREHRG